MMPHASPKGSGRHAPALAVALGMLLVAVLGYRWLPKADVPLPAVEDCRLDQQACAADLPGGGRLVISIDPRPIPTTQPLRIEVAVSGLEPAGVEVDFSGVGMNMGYNRPRLEALGAGRYAGQATLPVCVTGTMAWHATVRIEAGRQIISVPFRFDTRPG
jgi:hypothetical protein